MQLNVFPLPSLFWGERKAFILIETKIYKGKKQVQRRNTMLTINLDSCFGEATKGIWWNFITVSFFFDCLLKGQEIQIHVKKRTIIVFFPVFHYVDFFRLPSAPHVAGLKDERSFRSFIHTFINQRHIKHIKGPLQCVDAECVYVCVCVLWCEDLSSRIRHLSGWLAVALYDIIGRFGHDVFVAMRPHGGTLLPVASREVLPTFGGTWSILQRDTERMRLFVLWRVSHSARFYIKLELECGWVLFAFYHVLSLRILCFSTNCLKG